jgi:acyl carrier protein
MENIEKLKNAFKESLGVDDSIIVDTLAYQSIPEWDSISHMVLISQIEEAFDITIETEDVIDLSSFAKAREIVSKYGIQC